MNRFWTVVIPAFSLMGLSIAAFAMPDDFQTTINKAQATLTELDRTIAKIEARKGGRAAATTNSRGTARTGRRTAAPAGAARRTDTPAPNSRRAQTRGRNATRPPANTTDKKKPQL